MAKVEVLHKVLRSMEYFLNVKIRNLFFNFKVIKTENNSTEQPYVIGMMRERNESLLMKDTLDHISKFVDAIIVFDDDSGDDSVKIASDHPAVIEVIVNKRWRRHQRKWEETSNRAKLLSRAKKYNPEWFFYFDADERFEGDIKKYLKEDAQSDIDAIRISLLDAYITPGDKDDYNIGDQLMDFREKFGVERRDILMIWRNIGSAQYKLPDSREPSGFEATSIETRFWCQHYGKAVSIEQWEDTCKYYIENFPMYSEKWRSRVGKAVHDFSDFDTPLLNWEDAKRKSEKMY